MATARTDFSIRQLEPRDLDQWLELGNQVTAYPSDRASFLFNETLRAPSEPALRLSAWNPAGAFAGMADATLGDEGEVLTNRARASVAVVSPFRRLGLGERLIHDVERFAREANVRWIEGEVLEANLPFTAPFLTRLGYHELERYQLSVQNPATVNLSGLEALRERLQQEGIETTAFPPIDSEASRQSLYRCTLAIWRDMPHEPHVDWRDPPFGVFERNQFDRPAALADSLFVARDGDEIVGLTYFLRRPNGDAEVGDTGVLRSHRRRGIGRVLKMMASRYAVEHGINQVYTDNRADNAGMLAINRELGFSPGEQLVIFEKTLAR
ncbi:MAG TPA: GNAT family N-acetyltransferase [Candidatus Dormibacteraeota bacterium]|nr:GNAT family N-acetyltransferase [Candidatus Dormibacteraeota bacterium]